MATELQSLLGDKAESLLGFTSPKIPKERLHLPGPNFLDDVFMQSDRNNRVLNNLASMYNHGRLGWHRLYVHSAGGSRHRTFGRRKLREEPRLL